MALPGPTSAASSNTSHHNLSTNGVECSGKGSSNPGGGKGLYELWVGQKDGRITVLDASSLKVLKFLHNPLDQSKVPSFVAALSCNHMVSSISDFERGVALGDVGRCDFLSVYSALYHGQYVTRWNSRTKEAINCFNCQPHSENKGETKHDLIMGTHTGPTPHWVEAG